MNLNFARCVVHQTRLCRTKSCSTILRSTLSEGEKEIIICDVYIVCYYVVAACAPLFLNRTARGVCCFEKCSVCAASLFPRRARRSLFECLWTRTLLYRARWRIQTKMVLRSLAPMFDSATVLKAQAFGLREMESRSHSVNGLGY